MTKKNIPQEPAPLSPWGYWQESIQAWTMFSQQATKIVVNQLGESNQPQVKQYDANADTLASELLRSFADLNLRHWQNTARLLESFPSWMQVPHNITGSALVEWFDNLQRASMLDAESAPSASDLAITPTLAEPETLKRPDGKADDLTQIKGIGAKISSRLNDLGIYHFKQIANWTDAEAQWVDDQLSFKGRVAREAWIAQARRLSSNGTTIH